MSIKANDPKWLGQKFNKLTVFEFVYRQKRWMWHCQCDCGGESIAYPNQVIRGKTTSCGCNKSRTFHDMHLKHGMSGTRIYRIWKGMRRRCSDDLTHNHHYGDRGIKVSPEWNDFECFYSWAMISGYTDTMSIERKDPNGNYCPDNCTWIPLVNRNDNTTKTIMVILNGMTKPVGQWADDFGLKRSTVYGKIAKGMGPEEALGVL